MGMPKVRAAVQRVMGELGEIRAAAPDEVIRHEECRRILVRTSASGCDIVLGPAIAAGYGAFPEIGQ